MVLTVSASANPDINSAATKGRSARPNDAITQPIGAFERPPMAGPSGMMSQPIGAFERPPMSGPGGFVGLVGESGGSILKPPPMQEGLLGPMLDGYAKPKNDFQG